MSDFMPSSPKIDEIVAAHTTGQAADFERLKEALKGHLADANPQVAPAPRVALPVSQPAPTHLRRFYIGNNSFEIYSTSDANLNSQEAAIRALYSNMS